MTIARRAALVATFAVALLVATSPAGAFEAAGCAEAAPALASVRDAAGLRGHCDFIGTCPAGTAGGCVVKATVSVAGTGLVDAEVSGPFGALRCPLRRDGCTLTATWHLLPGTTSVFDCSATGVAVDVQFSCAVDPGSG